MTEKLALLGGEKVRTKPFPFPPYPIIRQEEKDAVLKAMDDGVLSGFFVSPNEFLGGKHVREFEQDFADYLGVKYAVAFSSATAALHAAVVSVGVKPGEEIITSPYTFTSSATCALMHNAIPLFADIEPETFCVDPRSVERSITPLTRAVIPVHIFGHPAQMDEIMDIARKHRLKVIEDCAQAPGAIYKGRKVGTIGDCGVFSFVESKNIETGEGGMLITNDDKIAEIARYVRNHGEAIADIMGWSQYSDIVGYNYRISELEAAIGKVQLRYLDEWNDIRRRLADHLSKGLSGFAGLTPPMVREGCTHVYYVYAFQYDETRIGIPRKLFAEALVAEGIPVSEGYVKPLYLAPLYQERKTFAFKHYQGKAKYHKGLCPVAEEMHFSKLLTTMVCHPRVTERDIDDIIRAVEKVLANKEELVALAQRHTKETSTV